MLNQIPETRTTLTALLLLFSVLTSITGCTGEAGHTVAVYRTGSNNTAFCPSFTESDVYRPRGQQIIVGPDDDWQGVIAGAQADTEVLLQDGVYQLTDYTVQVPAEVTLRGASGDRNTVTISGQGFASAAEALMLRGDNITIADLSIANVRDHAIAIKPELGAKLAPHIYNVHLYNTGTQHLKLSAGGAANGLVACSEFGYTQGASTGDYNGAIDLHESIDWVLRDNLIYNLNGDGSGCVVDTKCNTIISGPAILVWNNARGTVTERNRIFNSFRNIAYGLGRGHAGGVIRDNLIYRPGSGDAGIELQTAENVLVENNIVILAKDYRGGIEYRESSGLTIRNNTTSSRPWNRGRSSNVTVVDNTLLPNTLETCEYLSGLLLNDGAAIALNCGSGGE